MNRNWMPATLRWLTPEEGGRRQVPLGPEYATTARFFGDSLQELFSVVIRWPEMQRLWKNGENPVEISMLFPENLRSVESRLFQEPLIITEGPQPVAECRVLQPATV